jgi:hypothetical protein
MMDENYAERLSRRSGRSGRSGRRENGYNDRK